MLQSIKKMTIKTISAHVFGVLFLLVLSAVSHFAHSDCSDKAKVIKPVLSEETRGKYEVELAKATVVLGAEKLKADLSNDDAASEKIADEIIWVGRRLGYLGEYKKAIERFSNGIKSYPNDPRFYRHRGHRMITLRCFDDAISDFTKAAKLIKGRPDEVEPDGLPNARNIPTSTLQSNIWYHLGLAYYLKGHFKRAAKAYKNCLKVSKNPDMLVATTNWRYLSLRRLGRTNEAEKALEPIKDDLDIIENDGYYKLLKVYQRKMKAGDLLKEIGSESNSSSNASIGYGLGNWFLMNGEKEMAIKIFKEIIVGNQWSSFGFIAAEVELARLNTGM